MDSDTILSMTTRTGAGLEPALDGLSTAFAYTAWLVLLPARDGKCRWWAEAHANWATADVEKARRFKTRDHALVSIAEMPGARVLPLQIRMEVPDDHEGWKAR